MDTRARHDSPHYPGLLAEGFAWLDRLKSGEMTVAEGELLQRWRQQSALHRQAFAEAIAVSQALRAAASQLMSETTLARNATPKRARQAPLFTRRTLIRGAAAVSTVAATGVVVHAAFGPWPTLDELVGGLDADYRTATGERLNLTLAHVAIELNTQSSLAVLPSAAANGVRLIRGEVAIDTAGVPFTLQAGRALALAERAQFNVRIERDSTCITCIGGTLQIRHPQDSLVLSRGEQLLYTDREVRQIERADTGLATAWRRGMLIFHDQPLSYVVAEINRYRTGRIVLLSAALGRRRVYATFHLNRLDAAVEQLGEFTGARILRMGQMAFMS